MSNNKSDATGYDGQYIGEPDIMVGRSSDETDMLNQQLPIQIPDLTRMGEVRPSHPAYAPPVRAEQHVSNTVVYTREQKGHSLVLHLLFGGLLLWIPTIYFAVSPRHYFHV